MNKQLNKIIVLGSLFALAACSSSAPKGGGSGTSNGSGAKPGEGYVSQSSGSFKLKPYKESKLANGLKIIYIQDETLPRLSFTLLVRAGTLSEATPGLNAVTAYMLEQGSQTRSAVQLADELGQIGTDIDVVPSSDFTTLYTDGLTANADTLLTLFADVVMAPAFKDAELVRIKSQSISSLVKRIDNPSSYADSRMDAFLFGEHPYGRETLGTPDALRVLKKQDLIKHYLTYYRPNNATLAVVGNFSGDFEKKVEDTFGKWTKRTVTPPTVAPAAGNETLKMKFLSKRGLQQTQIRIAELGIARQDPDYLVARVGNEILGGSFASRLNQKIRDDQGLTYSIYSNFDVRKEPGSFEVNTFTKNESVGKTVDETLKAVREFVASGATEKELEAAKMQLIGQFPRAIETADRLAYNLLALDFYGIPVTYLTQFNDNVRAIKLKQVNEVLQKKINPEQFKVLIYGDSSVLPQLKEWKPEVERVGVVAPPVVAPKPAAPAAAAVPAASGEAPAAAPVAPAAAPVAPAPATTN